MRFVTFSAAVWLAALADAANCIVTTAIGTANDKGTAIAVQYDGKILLAGYALVGASDDFALVRYNADFSLDISFGTNGIVTTDFFGAEDRAEAIAIQPDGKILLVGHATNGGNRDFALARYNLNGTLDTTFGGGSGKATTALPGGWNEQLEGVAVQTDGKIVVAGFTQRPGSDYVVARYNANGTLDTAGFASPNGYYISTNGVSDDATTEVAIQPDGRIVVGGWVNQGGSNDDFAVVRFTAAGAPDPTFNGGSALLINFSGGRDRAENMVLQPDGKIVLVGSARSGWDLFAVARVTSTGALDTATFNPAGTFGNAPNLAGRVTVDFTAVHDAAFGVVLQPDGKIVLGGWSNWDGGGTAVDFALTRHNSDGSLDGTFGVGGKVTTPVGTNNDWIDSLALQPDGRILAGGYIRIGTNDDFAAARYNTNGTIDTRCTTACAPLYTSEGAGTITVTSPNSFEMTFDVVAGGAVNKFYDLAEDPGRVNDLGGGSNPRGLHNHGFRVGGVNYNSSVNDTGPRLSLLEATSARVRVRQEAFYEDNGTGDLLPGAKGLGDYSVYPSGKTALRWTRSAALDVVLQTEYAEFIVHYTNGVPPLDSWAASSETDNTSPNPGTDRFFLFQNEVAGARTDFLHILYRDWTTANHFGTADNARWNPSISGARINAWWEDSYLPGTATLPAGSSEFWSFLTYFKPTNFAAFSGGHDPAVTSRMIDYRTPDALLTLVGGPWIDVSENTGGGDDFNESEGAYLLTYDPSLGLRFRIDGASPTRRDPFFKIRQWRSLNDPATVTLEGATLTNDVQYKADVKPFARALRANTLAWHCTLQMGTSCTPPNLDVGSGGNTSGGVIVDGRYGNGFSATTNTDTITASSSDFNVGAGAVELWYRPNYASSSGTPHLIWHNISAGNDFFRLEHTGGNLVFEICVDGTAPGCTGGTSRTVSVLPASYRWSANEWVHLRTEWTTSGGGSLRVFFNGVQVGSTSPFSAVGLTNGTTVFGSCSASCPGGGAGRNADGIIDEPHIYTGLGSGGNPEVIGYAGLTSSASEFLASTTANATLLTTAVDASRRGVYLYFGSDSKFQGLNVALATAGIGTAPNIQWDFWNGANWTNLESGFGFTDQTNNLTVKSGTIFWTGDPAGWSLYSVNGGPDLYYVRAYLASGDYATQAPVEGLIKTDILLFQYCGDITLDNQTFDFPLPQPTAVELVSFTAEAGDGVVTLRWRTGSELDNLGFHLYRAASATGPFARVTQNPIPGLGSSPAGASYSFRDSGLSNGETYFYELEDIERSGKTERHGPVSATPSSTSASSASSKENEGTARIVYGNPSANELRILSRTRRGLVLELRTEGFYATANEDGSVSLEVPGLEVIAEASSVPVRRSWIEVESGLGVRVAAAQADGLERFPEFLPSTETSRIVGSRSGVAELRRERRRGSERSPETGPWARLVDQGYQGDVKKALVELAPFRVAGNELVLAKRIEVRLLFSGREETPGEKHRRARRRRDDARRALTARIVTRERGLYAVRFEDLFGSRSRVEASSLRLSRLGEDVPFHLLPSSDRFGPGSTLLFASDGAAANPYDNEAAYELSLGAPSKRMPLVDGRPAGARQAFHWQRIVREESRLYQAGRLSPPDLFVWDMLFAPARKHYAFELTDLATDGGDARLTVVLLGASDTGPSIDHHVLVSVNGAFAGEHFFDGEVLERTSFTIPASLLREGTNELTLENLGDTGAPYSMVMLDSFELRYPRRALAKNGFLEGSWDGGTAAVENAGARPMVLEREGETIRWLANVESDGRGGARFQTRAGKTYWVVASEALLVPEIRRLAPPSLQRGGTDYLVIGPRELLDAARGLLEHRQEQGLRVQAVPIELVYDEFGHGERRPEAIREFLRHAYHDFEPRPRYVVLLGDGTYDYKDVLETGVRNQVPPLLVKTSYLWTASDPTLASVNGDDELPDLAIGRLPAASVEEVRVLVAKILAWERAVGHLDGRAVLVADNPDRGGDFVGTAEEAASSILAGREVERIYLTELGASGASAAIRDAFARGSSIWSYLGHGGIHLWASENLLDVSSVSALAPQSRQPFLLTMNCLNGYFHFPYFNSLSEELLKAEGKGVIGAFSPTGLSFHAPAEAFHGALMREIVRGGHARLGDAVLAAQAAYAETGAFPELLRIYHLLGDPGLKLR